jgi:hypothetical protein
MKKYCPVKNFLSVNESCLMLAYNVRGFVQVWKLKIVQPEQNPNYCLLLKDKLLVD